MAYDETKDKLVMAYPPVTLDNGTRLEAGVYSYDGGDERLRVNLIGQGKRREWSQSVAKITLADRTVAIETIRYIMDAFEIEELPERI